MKRRITAIVLAMMLVMAPVTSFGLDTVNQSDEPTFKYFPGLGGVSYYDIYGGQTEDRPDIDDMDSIIDQVLYGKFEGNESWNKHDFCAAEYWANYARAIFAANPSSWRENGEKDGYGKGKSVSDFYDRFGMDPYKGNNDYGDVGEALCSDSRYERSTKEKSKYRKCDINMIASGKLTANNLSQVQDTAFQYLVDVNPGKIKKSHFAEYNSLKAMSEDTGNSGPVIYYLMAMRDREGGTFFYEYNCFGIAYSDFTVTPITGEDGEGLTTALNKYDNYEEAVKEIEDGVEIEGFVYDENNKIVVDNIENKGTGTITKSVSKDWSEDETLTSEISTLKGKSFSAGQTASFSFGKDDAIFRAEAGVSFTEEELFEEGMSSSNSTSFHDGGSSTQDVEVPGHTVVQQVISTNTYNADAKFDCPVVISYKVTIFSYNGCYYDDNAATTYFNTAGYEQRSFMAQFGNDEDAAGAQENLRVRMSKDSGYDKTHGITKGICVRHAYSDDADWDNPWVDHLDYTSIKSAAEQMQTETRPEYQDMISSLTNLVPISITGGVMKRAGTSVTAVINEAIPVYPLTSVSFAKAQRDIVSLMQNEDLHLRNIGLEGWDSENIEFYNFKIVEGYWSIVNKAGKQVDESDAVKLYQNKNGDYVVRAMKPGKATIQYFVEDDAYQYMGKDGEPVKIKGADVETPVMTIVVREDKSTPAKIAVQNAATVTYEDSSNEIRAKIDMDMIDGLDAVVYDTKGKVMEVAADWSVVSETDGIVIEDNMLYVYKDGTYDIKASYKDVESDVAKLTVKNAAVDRAVSAGQDSGSADDETVQVSDESESANDESVQVSDEAVEATKRFLSCDSDKASLAEACFFVKNKLGKDSTLNEIIYAETLFELAGDQSCTDEQKEYELQAVLWAVDNDLIDRDLYNVISANGGINKTQMVTLAYNAAVKFGRDVTCEDAIGAYGGCESLTDSQKKAMNWAISKGCVTDAEKASMTLDMDRIITDYDLSRFE